LVVAIGGFGCGVAAVSATQTSASVTPAESDASAPPNTGLRDVLVRRHGSRSVRIAASTGPIVLDFAAPATALGPSLAGASIDCGRHTFHLTTGTSQGTCTIDRSTGSASCVDGSNNVHADCKHGCSNSAGAGDCLQSSN
jgi:hypothetical protein